VTRKTLSSLGRERLIRKKNAQKAAPAMQTTTSKKNTGCGISSCSTSGRTSTNGLHIIRNSSPNDTCMPPCASSNKMKIDIIMPVAANARA
jgi:hypothetical protein